MTPLSFQSEIWPLRNKLFRYAMNILGNSDIAADVIQEVFLKLWEKRNELHHINNKEAWCMRLTRNAALDKFRSKVSQWDSDDKLYRLQSELATPEKIASVKDEFSMVQQVIDKLSAQQKEVLLLRDMEGHSYDEIAEITGRSLSSVKVDIFRGRKAVKKYLENMHAYETRR